MTSRKVPTYLFFRVINRLVSLISRTAQLQAAYDAAIRQAQGANQAAKTLLEAGDSEALDKATKETEEFKKKLRKAEQDRDAMKKQAENLQEEYDRVCTLLNESEVSLLLIQPHAIEFSENPGPARRATNNSFL